MRRALIPAAGFGTRLFPASKATKKELFPIIDRDGIAKPAILLIVEEALEAGIEEVVIIVQEDDLEDFRSFFTAQVSIENYNKLPPRFQDYARRILEIGRRVRFVTQTAQEGFGHAVYCAPRGARRRAVPADARATTSTGRTAQASCARQLVEAYQRSRARASSACGRTPEAEIAAFGAATGVWVEPERLPQRDRVRREADRRLRARSTCACPGCPTASTSPSSAST